MVAKARSWSWEKQHEAAARVEDEGGGDNFEHRARRRVGRKRSSAAFPRMQRGGRERQRQNSPQRSKTSAERPIGLSLPSTLEEHLLLRRPKEGALFCSTHRETGKEAKHHSTKKEPPTASNVSEREERRERHVEADVGHVQKSKEQHKEQGENTSASATTAATRQSCSWRTPRIRPNSAQRKSEGRRGVCMNRFAQAHTRAQTCKHILEARIKSLPSSATKNKPSTETASQQLRWGRGRERGAAEDYDVHARDGGERARKSVSQRWRLRSAQNGFCRLTQKAGQRCVRQSPRTHPLDPYGRSRTSPATALPAHAQTARRA